MKYYRLYAPKEVAEEMVRANEEALKNGIKKAFDKWIERRSQKYNPIVEECVEERITLECEMRTGVFAYNGKRLVGGGRSDVKITARVHIKFDGCNFMDELFEPDCEVKFCAVDRGQGMKALKEDDMVAISLELDNALMELDLFDDNE